MKKKLENKSQGSDQIRKNGSWFICFRVVQGGCPLFQGFEPELPGPAAVPAWPPPGGHLNRGRQTASNTKGCCLSLLQTKQCIIYIGFGLIRVYKVPNSFPLPGGRDFIQLLGMKIKWGRRGWEKGRGWPEVKAPFSAPIVKKVWGKKSFKKVGGERNQVACNFIQPWAG